MAIVKIYIILIFLLYLVYAVYKFQSIYLALIFIVVPLSISLFVRKEIK